MRLNAPFVACCLALLVVVARPAAAESVTTFEADCVTMKFIFTQGDTVCAKVTGVTLPGASRFRWIAGDSSVAQDGPTVTAEGQTDLFTIPANLVQAKRGSWQVDVLRNSDDTPLAGGSFAVLETIRIFAADCVTPRTLFALGDTACATVSNLPSPVNIYLQWIAPDFTLAVVPPPSVTTDPQTFTFVIPTSGPEAQTGGWLARTANVADASGRISTPFTVVASLSALTVAKTFSPVSILPGGTSRLTVTLTNPNVADLHASFIDSYSPGLVNGPTPAAATTCTSGVVTAATGAGLLKLDGGTVPAGGSCTVAVTVTAAVPDVYANSLAPASVTTVEGLANTVGATAQLTVLAPAVVAVPTLSGSALALAAVALALAAGVLLRRAAR